MKKIISVLALSSLAFSVAFADVKFSLQYKTVATAFSRVMSLNNENGKTYTNSKASTYLYDTFLLKQRKGVDEATDTFKMSVSNDFAGVTLSVNPYAYSDYKEFATTADGHYAFKQYSGYIKLGPITFNAGYWQDGVMAGSYQLKKDADDSSLTGANFMAYKLGSIYKGAITNAVTDIVGFSGTRSPSAYIEYKGDIGDATLTARLSAISLGRGNKYNDDATNAVESGFAAQLDAKFESFDAEFTFKQKSVVAGSEERALSLYLQPLTWGNLSATFGGALGFYEGDLIEYNADVRFRYVNGPLSITSANNISHVTVDGAKAKSITDYEKHMGAWFLDKDGKAQNANNSVASTAMWNTLGIFFKANATFTPFVTLGDMVGFKSHRLTNNAVATVTEENFGDYGVEFFVNPGIQIFASKNAHITASCRMAWSHLFMDSDRYKDYGHEMAILVPVIMRVKL